MQLTRFDRWLREKFVYETHIRTLRPLESVPGGVRAIKLPEKPGQRYRHLFIARSSKDADAVIQQLKKNSQMYKTQIVDRDAWYIPLIAPKDKSVSWWLISLVVFTISGASVVLYIKNLLSDPMLRKEILEALQILQG